MSAKIDWVAVERDYCQTQKSLREIGQLHGISEGAIRKKAKAGAWVRKDLKKVRTPRKVRTAYQEVKSAQSALGTPQVEPDDVATKGQDIVGRLFDELGSVTTHVGELEDMIIAETDGDDSDRRRDAMLKAVSLGTRSNVARNLASALKTLQESSGASGKKGKKEQQQDAAERIASSGKFAPRGKPKLIVDNGR